jgi:hypothetical protein
MFGEVAGWAITRLIRMHRRSMDMLEEGNDCYLPMVLVLIEEPSSCLTRSSIRIWSKADFWLIIYSLPQ